MKEKTKKRFWLILIILLIGIWFGYNIGQDRPFYSNPFVPATKEKIKQKAGEVARETKEKADEAMKKTKDALRESLKEKEE